MCRHIEILKTSLKPRCCTSPRQGRLTCSQIARRFGLCLEAGSIAALRFDLITLVLLHDFCWVSSQVQQRMLSKRRVRTYLYKQLNLRLFYKGLHISSDGSGKEREIIAKK